MVPIDLDDEVPQPSQPGRSRLGRRTGRRLAIGVVVVVLALVAGQWAADARERADWDRLSDRTDVVVPVGRSLAARWSLDDSTFVTVSQGIAWRGTVVGPVLAPDGSIGIVQLDDRDGRRRWTAPVMGPDAARAAK